MDDYFCSKEEIKKLHDINNKFLILYINNF